MSRTPVVSLLVLLVAVALPAGAADRTVLGARLTVRNPDPAAPGRRRVFATGIERGSPDPIVGDPTVPGGKATLSLVLRGATPTSQTFDLAQGTAASGRPFWRPNPPDGYRYDDPRGEQGPVQFVLLTRTGRGTFRVKARLRGRTGALDVVPPDPGTHGWLTLALDGGDRYCVQYGRESVVRNVGARLLELRRPSAEGCPPPSGEFLALSYNVAGLPEGISGSHPATNTPLIAPLLNGYDLVLVQESWKTPDPNPLAPLRVYHEILEAGSLHPYQSVSAPLPLGTDPRRPSALVSDGLNWFSQFPFAGVVREAWAGCWTTAADCLALKGFAVFRMTLAPGVTVDVYDLHMEAGGAPEDDALRDQAVTQLADFMAVYSAGRAVIVGGDFNLHTDAEPDASQFARLLAETGLADVCATLGCPQPGRIDKFLFRSNDALAVTPLSWRFETDVFVDPDTLPLSDHDALATRFAWAAADD